MSTVHYPQGHCPHCGEPMIVDECHNCDLKECVECGTLVNAFVTDHCPQCRGELL